MQLSIHEVSKSFSSLRAVDQVSFEVESGRLFGLLGPNGAGKTTLIRMLMDIIQPDSGRILYSGQPLSDDLKNRIAYLPEERGLYLKQKVKDVLEYFGRLKGLSGQAARSRSKELMQRLGMEETAERKVEELSKGNQQKIQLISVFVSQPELVILDEPFTGLDPINLRVCKSLLQEGRKDGATILLSTHQMNQVEELCDDLVMISGGRRVLYGAVDHIIRDHSDSAVLLSSRPEVDAAIPGVERVEGQYDLQKVFLDQSASPSDLLHELVERRFEISEFRRALPSLEEIFVRAAEQSGSPQPQGGPA